MAAPEVSVVVCTHNPRADYFARTLAGLRAQSLSPERWELVLIDNLSAEPLKGRIDLSWRPRARIVREETLGLTPARLRGIREAAGELLVFVDDDNVLEPDYLEQALQLAGSCRFLGAWSGQCLPEFEVPPPEWTRRYWGNLCIRTFQHMVWSNLPRLPETMPAGAGLCVRRVVAEDYLEVHERGARAFQLDRTGASLVSGGDNDLAAMACRRGLGVGLCPELKLKHLIPPQRLSADYLARLAEGIAFSSTVLDAEWGLDVAGRGQLRRALDLLRQLRLRSPHREISKAATRGRDSAIKAIRSGLLQMGGYPTAGGVRTGHGN